MVYLLTAVGLSPVGSTHLHKKKIHRTTQIITEQHKYKLMKNGRAWAVPRLCEFYPGICLTTEEKARKNLSQGKKNLSQVKKNLSQVKKNLSQVKKNLNQCKKNLSQMLPYRNKKENLK